MCEFITTKCPGLQSVVPRDLAYMTGLFHDCPTPLMLGKFIDYKAAFYSVLNNALRMEMEDKQFSTTNHALASYLMAKTRSIIDELFLGEDGIAGLTDGVDELSA